MKIALTDRVIELAKDAPAAVQRAFDKQLHFLANNLHHPSLRAKKFDEANDVWQARVSRGWRFYFIIEEDRYVITNIIPHPK